MARKEVDYVVELKMDNASNTTVDAPFEFLLSGLDIITIESEPATPVAWVTSTVTFEVTNDRERGNWKAVPSGAVTITSAAITDAKTVTGIKWGRLRVSAAAASDFRARFAIHGEGGD